MGRTNRRSNRGMNRRSKRSKRSNRSNRTKRTNMRGGGDVSIVINNVGPESIIVDLWDNTTTTWTYVATLPPNRITDSKSTSVGAAWRVTGLQRDTVGTRELSWVLGDDSKQVIAVNFTPSSASVTVSKGDDYVQDWKQTTFYNSLHPYTEKVMRHILFREGDRDGDFVITSNSTRGDPENLRDENYYHYITHSPSGKTYHETQGFSV
jgi:hypothetical protein